MSVVERSPSYKESNKGSKQRQGPTLGVHFSSVHLIEVKRELTDCTVNSLLTDTSVRQDWH